MSQFSILKSHERIFISLKGYTCINSNEIIFISRHVAFNEEHFPLHDGLLNTKDPLQTLTESSSFIFPLSVAGISSSNTPIPIGNHSDTKQEPDDHDEPVNSYSRLEGNNGQATNDSISNTEQTSLDEPDDHDEPTASTIPLESNS